MLYYIVINKSLLIQRKLHKKRPMHWM